MRTSLLTIILLGGLFCNLAAATESFAKIKNSLENESHNDSWKKQPVMPLDKAKEHLKQKRIAVSEYETELILAIKSNDTKTAEALIVAGTYLNGDSETTPLREAAKQGQLHIMNLLLNKGANPKLPSEEKSTLTSDAASSGKVQTLELLLEKGIPLTECKSPRAPKVMVVAAGSGSLQCVDFLHKHGFALNDVAPSGSTIMHYAAMSGNTKLLRYLKSKKVPIDTINAAGFTPLFMAAFQGQDACVRYLIKSGARLDTNKTTGGDSVIHHIAYACKPETLDYAVSKGANLHATDKQRKNVLNWASEKYNLPMMKHLLKKGITVDINTITNPEARKYLMNLSPQRQIETDEPAPRKKGKNKKKRKYKQTMTREEAKEYLTLQGIPDNLYYESLAEAIKGNDPQLAEAILVAGVNKNDINRYSHLLQASTMEGKTPFVIMMLEQGIPPESPQHLTGAATISGDVELMKVLKKRGYKLDPYNQRDRHNFVTSMSNGNINYAEYMNNEGFSYSLLDNYGNTTMHFAACSNNPELLMHLQENGIPLDKPNNDGLTPIFYAAERGKGKCVRYLIDEGVRLNRIEKKNGKTLIHILAANCDIETLDYAVSKGVDLEALDKNGHNALYWAGSSSSDKAKEMIKHLYDKGMRADTDSLTYPPNRQFLRNLQKTEK